MLWIWLLVRNRHTWSTGNLDRYFAFLCGRCGATTSAMVRTFGFGNGSSLAAAQHKAQMMADAHAHRTVAAATCPSCSQLQPSFLAQFDHAEKRAARRRALRLPFAAVAAVVVAILLAIPAVPDLRHSVMLAVVAACTALAVGALVFALFSTPVGTPPENPLGVWFSFDPSQGPGSWFPARRGHAPRVTQPARTTRVFGVLAMGAAGLASVVALVAWSHTFRKLHVVSAEGPGRSLVVRVDGEPLSLSEYASADAPNATIELRTSSSHRVVAVDAEGRETTYVLDPATAKNGWVLAPNARERGLCLASLTWYYGTGSKDGDDKLLGEDGDLAALPHAYDVVFAPPPATVQVESGSSATRTTLRALTCEGLERDAMIPFKDAAPP